MKAITVAQLTRARALLLPPKLIHHTVQPPKTTFNEYAENIRKQLEIIRNKK